MITFENITIAYGGTTVVRDFSLAIKAGEFFTLLGPSGCGKSTILKCLAGFLPQQSGRILVGGKDVSALGAEDRGIGLVFQNYALFPHLSVFENVAFGLRVARMGQAEIEQKVDEFLRLVGIAEHAQKRPAELSGGQQQRVAIARSLITGPKILLMDEPLSNLDVKLRIAMRNEIKRLQRQLKFTTIYVTHDQEEALSLSDRLAVLNAGRIAQLGTAAEIYQTPSSQFVCQFIGEANELTPPTQALFGIADARGSAFLRPEHIRLAGGPDRAPQCMTEAVVEDWTYMGADTRLKFRVGEQSLDCTLASLDAPTLAVGDTVRIGFDRPQLLAFPPDDAS